MPQRATILTAALIASLASGAACRERSDGQIRASYDDSGKLRLLTYDSNKNGKPDTFSYMSPPEAFQPVLEAVKGLGIEPDAAEIAMLPQNYVKLEGKAAQQMVKLMDILEDHEDSKKVWSNADIEEKEIEASLA